MKVFDLFEMGCNCLDQKCQGWRNKYIFLL